MDEAERKATREEFRRMVNMTPTEVERWLGTDASKEVGWTHAGEHESVGHRAGRRIVELKRKAQDDLTEDDLELMRKLIGYCHCHLAQRPSGDVRETRWRYSLMNWGYDPLRD